MYSLFAEPLILIYTLSLHSQPLIFVHKLFTLGLWSALFLTKPLILKYTLPLQAQPLMLVHTLIYAQPLILADPPVCTKISP